MAALFLDIVLLQFGVSRVGQLSSPILNKLKKYDLIDMVNNSLCYLNDLAYNDKHEERVD